MYENRIELFDYKIIIFEQIVQLFLRSKSRNVFKNRTTVLKEINARPFLFAYTHEVP
jgi:hypothetical protein